MKTRLAAALMLISLAVFADDRPAEASVSTSTTSAITIAPLSTGRKIIQCTAITHYRACDNGVCTATTSDLKLAADEKWETDVTPGGRYIAFVNPSGTGTCRIYPVNL